MKIKLFFNLVLIVVLSQTIQGSELTVKNFSKHLVKVGFIGKNFHTLNPGGEVLLKGYLFDTGEVVWHQYNDCPKKPYQRKCAVTYKVEPKLLWPQTLATLNIKDNGKHDYKFDALTQGKNVQAAIIKNECQDC